MIIFDQWYRRLGLIRPSQVLNPKVLSANTLFYPINSDFYYFRVSDAPESVSRNIGVFNKPESVLVLTFSEYGNTVEGTFRKKPFSINTYIKQLSLKEKDFRFLRPSESKIAIKKKTLVIKNFACINHNYIYPKNRFVKLWKFNNTFNSVIDAINVPDKVGEVRNKFLYIELPNFLPKREILDMYCKNLTLQRLNSIPSYKYFTLLELWKFLTPELKEKSLFNKINVQERGNVNFVFVSGTGASILNMGILENLITEYYVDEKNVGTESVSTDENIDRFLMSLDYNLFKDTGIGNESVKLLGKTTYKANIFRKMFLLYLNKIITAGEYESVADEENFEEMEKVEVAKSLKEDQKAKEEVNKEVKDTEEELEKESELSENVVESVLDKMMKKDMAIYNKKTEDNETLLGDKETQSTGEEDEEDTIEEDAESLTTVLDQAESTKEYKTLDEVLNARLEDPKDTIKNKISTLKENGLLSSRDEKMYLEILAEQDKLQIPIEEIKNLTVGEALDINNDDKTDVMQEYEVTPNKTVLDESYNKKTVEGYDKQYLTGPMFKDKVRTVYSLQNAGILVTDYNVEKTSNVLDSNELHTIKIKPLNGAPSTIKFIMPSISEDGTFRMSGNTYRMRKQRVERTIRKINPTTVVLTSYYGKLFISKANVKISDYGYFLLNTLTKNPNIHNIVLGTSDLMDKETPRLYAYIARYVKSFVEDKFCLNFDYSAIPYDYSKNGYIWCGISKPDQKDIPDSILLMDKDGMLYYTPSKNKESLPNQLTEYKHILDVIGVNNHNDGPVEFASIKIGKGKIPIVILLSYYLGLNNLLKVLNTKHNIFDVEDRANWKKFDGNNAYKLRFRDKIVFIEKDNGKSDIIIGGLKSIKELSEITYDSFNSKDKFGMVFSNLEYPVSYTTEIKLLEDMFVDPMTRTLLRQNKEPETFTGLLILAADLLSSEKYPKPTDMEGQVIKGYERLNGMLYKSLINSIKEHENRTSFSKSKIVLDPYSILTKIKDDSTTVLVDDLNPVAETKQKEDLSYLGEGGQNAISMTKGRRAIDPTEIGIISEAHKDNGDVGITAYLNPDFNITNIRGNVKSVDVSKEGWGKILSTPALMAPFGTHDDSKRLNFVSIMGAHVVPVNDMVVPRVRTGYEGVLPTRVSDKFCIIAKDRGTVEKVTPTEVVVKYGKDTETYKIKSWTTKEEAGVCYTYTLVPNVSKGDVVDKDDTILYNPKFFEPDIFNPKRVLYKQGTLVTVAVKEDTEEYEDSASISYGLTSRMGTSVTKVLSIVIKDTDTILNVTDIGKAVEPQDVLFSFMDAETNLSMKDSKMADIFKDIQTSSPKAKVKGIVKNIVVYYNTDLNNIKSKDLVKFIQASDERLMQNKGFIGRVNSSYSIAGKPLLPGEIEIKYYIEVGERMSIGDKGILGNQLKFTVGDIYTNKHTTVDSNEEVDLKFGFIAMKNRITISPELIGTTSSLLEILQKKMVEMYFDTK